MFILLSVKGVFAPFLVLQNAWLAAAFSSNRLVIGGSQLHTEAGGFGEQEI